MTLVAAGFLMEMLSGTAGMILQTSKYYWYISIVKITGIGLIIILSYVFIPLYGIWGAGLAAGLTRLFSALAKYLFLLIRFGMQPYDKKIAFIVIIAILSYISVFFIPVFNNWIIDTLIRSFIYTSAFMILTLSLKPSKEIDQKIRFYYIWLNNRIR
jgi:O-antigen/teichoic acid export membrane protein